MISIVLYGRNDNYGYNLHKRAALSLNCMAEVLTDPADEILFVDYNTPNDFPTFPEAIADTLTDKAKRHLKILRVRPEIHARFAGRTHLIALEPVARNIAVRRSNPANRWILSTNTDMIFVPRKGQSLSEIARDLPAGHYGIPRFELPETLWEAFDRRDPAGIIASIGRWGWDLHLNEIVSGMSPFLFDGPGDFQLIARDDLFKINGFDEDMLRGWHVDANIAKRLSFIHGDVGDLTDEVFGYHCDHTRQVTPAHKANAVQNDMMRFFHDVRAAEVPAQSGTWGCADDDIEQIPLTDLSKSPYFQAISTLARTPLGRPLESDYLPKSFSLCNYSPEHVLPFLLDIFASAPRHWTVAWLGVPGRMLSLFSDGWQTLGFKTEPLVRHAAENQSDAEGAANIRICSYDEIVRKADAFIFDFSDGNGANLGVASVQNRLTSDFLVQSFRTVVAGVLDDDEREASSRRFIGINAIHNQFEDLFGSQINCAKTPFSVRIRHGFLMVSAADLPRREKPDPARSAMPHEARRLKLEATAAQSEDLMVAFASHAGKNSFDDGIILGRGNSDLVQASYLDLPSGQYAIEVNCRRAASGRPAFAILNHMRVTRLRPYAHKLAQHSTLRRAARSAARVFGPTISTSVKSTLRRMLAMERLDAAELRLDGVLEISVHLDGKLLAQHRARGPDVVSLPHALNFEIGSASLQPITISVCSNGGGSFQIYRALLKKCESALPAVAVARDPGDVQTSAIPHASTEQAVPGPIGGSVT